MEAILVTERREDDDLLNVGDGAEVDRDGGTQPTPDLRHVGIEWQDPYAVVL